MHMSRETVRAVASRIAEHTRKHSLEGVQIVLHGGEPLLAGAELIEYGVTKVRQATEVQVNVVMQTNGVLLDSSFLKLFDALDIHVGISLDGDADAHDSTPGTLGVSVFLGCSAFRVLYVFLSLFSWWCRRRAGMGGTRVSRRVRRAVPRSAAPGRGRFLLPDGLYPGR